MDFLFFLRVLCVLRGEFLFLESYIFADDDDVIPDVAWISRERLRKIIGKDGHFHAAPDLVVEVLSPGSANERRDRETKLKLYSRRGVLEYWIVNWIMRDITVFRRKGKKLKQVETFRPPEILTSPLLPGFELPVLSVFNTYAEFSNSHSENGNS